MAMTEHRSGLSRRGFLDGLGLFLAVALPTAVRQSAKQSGAAAPSLVQDFGSLIDDLVIANHILVDQGVNDGFGHLSVRHPVNPNHYLVNRIDSNPGLVSAHEIMEFDLDSNAIDPRGHQGVGERFIHGEIYKARPDVKAVVHCHTPALIPFGVTGVKLRPLYHMSAFIVDEVPIFDIQNDFGITNMLIHNSAQGHALAQTLGDKPAALMRGHGAVIVGESVQQVVPRSVYLMTNAKMQAEAMSMGREIKYLDPEEARKVNQSTWTLDFPRDWELWKYKVMHRCG
jgi:ribulose-5-phosphate 4-epimerase/fuculose-1-phosphate aldolase